METGSETTGLSLEANSTLYVWLVVSTADVTGDGDGNNNNQQGADGEDGTDPFESFNIKDCATYESLWTWDAILTCSDEAPSDCSCGYAETLMENEFLTCADMESCPSECQICESCMQLLGCERTVAAGTNRSGVIRSTRWYIIAAAAAVVLAGALYSYVRVRRDHVDAELTHQLLEEPEGAAAAAASASPGGSSGVWLAPDTEVDQFEPSMRAALTSYTATAPAVVGGAEATSSISNPSEEDVWLAPVT